MIRKVKLKYTLTFLLLAAAVSVVSIVLRTFYQPEEVVVVENEVKEILQADTSLASEPVVERPVILPADFAFHSGFQHEWWNYAATVYDNQGQRYFVQWSYFRLANADKRDSLGWSNSQIYTSHIAISTDKKIWKEQRIARGGIGQAGLNNPPFRIWIDNWAWRSLGRTAFPGHLDVKSDQFSVSLYSDNHGRLILPGNRGFQKKHSSLPIATYNMQAPYLSVYGQLQLEEGSTPISVKGTAWMSKEWGSGLMTDSQQGWDWFVINLNEQTTLSLKRMRHDTELPYVIGTLSTRNGKLISLTHDDVSITPLNNVELDNGKALPMAWRVTLPNYDIDVTTHVDNPNSWLPFAIPYWQGSVHTTGTHAVNGFIQSVGY